MQLQETIRWMLADQRYDFSGIYDQDMLAPYITGSDLKTT